MSRRRISKTARTSPRVGRRSLLAGAASLLATSALPLTWTAAGASTTRRVKDIAADRDILFGSAFDEFVYDDDDYADLLRRECAILTSDYSLKFGAIRPEPDWIEFEAGDRLLAFAEEAGVPLRGHTLIWNEWMPDWVRGLSASDIEALHARHIDETAGRYAGRIHSWDVVNEPIWIDHGHRHGLRGGPWYEAMGESYIERSFRRARAADPHAKLVLNEVGMELSGEEGDELRAALMRLIHDLLDRGAPLDAIGIESHLQPPDYDRENFLAFLEAVQSLGLEIYITELDVLDDYLPDDVEVRDRMVADFYKVYLSDVVRYPAVKVISTWELADRYSWLANPEGAKAGDRQRRPLPFDRYLNPKPAYYAIAAALSNG